MLKERAEWEMYQILDIEFRKLHDLWDRQKWDKGVTLWDRESNILIV